MHLIGNVQDPLKFKILQKYFNQNLKLEIMITLHSLEVTILIIISM